MPECILIIPVYNEAERLQLEAFQRLPADSGIQFLFVDDGSTDATAAWLNAACERFPERIRQLRLTPNRGKAEAIRQGLLSALAQNPSYVGYLDADLATPVTEAARLLAVLRQSPGVSVVLGSRIKRLGSRITRRPWRHYAGRVFATGVSWILHLPVYDTQCGAKFFRNEPSLHHALSTPFSSRWIFDVELIGRLLQAYASGNLSKAEERFVEVPLLEWTDVPGSKLNLADYAAACFDLLGLAWTFRRLRRTSP